MKTLIKKITVLLILATMFVPRTAHAATNEDIVSEILGHKVRTALVPAPAPKKTGNEKNEDIVSSIIGTPVKTYPYAEKLIDSIADDLDPAILAYKEQYPTGSKWGADDYYLWRANSVYRGGYGCAGFAYMLSDAIYGDVWATKIEGNDDIAKYDCIELWGNKHTAFVLDYDPTADRIIVVEANVNDSGDVVSGGKVKWGTVYHKSDVSAVLKR